VCGFENFQLVGGVPSVVVMGTSCTKQKQTFSPVSLDGVNVDLTDPACIQRVIIEVRRATNVPNMDGFLSRGSDCFVEAQLSTNNGTKLGDMASWPVINSEVNPVWNKVRVIEQAFPSKSKVTFTLVDLDNSLETLVRGRDIIGTVSVPISSLVDNKEKELKVKLTKSAAKKSDRQECSLFVRLVPEPSSAKKTAFFIRHGESKWNEAQAGLNLVNMLKEYDHGLSETGKGQAEGLSEDIAANKEDPDVVEMLGATTIFCSPLTRAIQTTLIGLQAHPVLTAKGLVLTKDAREVKKIGGFDTVGMAHGVDMIKERVKKEVSTLYSNADDVQRLTGVAFEGGDAANEWWTHPETADSKTDIESRLDDLLAKIRYAADNTVVVTGHSLLWKEMYKTRGNGCEEVKRFGHRKMPNCGVVKCEIDFSAPRDQVLTSMKLLFGKELLGHQTKEEEEEEEAQHEAQRAKLANAEEIRNDQPEDFAA
jgi:broad specificity phosphatase PhoE